MSPDEQHTQAQLRAAVVGAAAVLFPAGREVVMHATIAVVLQGKRVRTAAAEAGLPEATLRRAVRRLVQRLKIAELRMRSGQVAKWPSGEVKSQRAAGGAP